MRVVACCVKKPIILIPLPADENPTTPFFSLCSLMHVVRVSETGQPVCARGSLLERHGPTTSRKKKAFLLCHLPEPPAGDGRAYDKVGNRLGTRD